MSGEEAVIHIATEVDIALCFLLFLLGRTYVSPEPLLVDLMTIIKDRWC
jgi:hypothetical protein